MKNTIGIDIGTENVKIVCLEKRLQTYRLAACGLFPYRGQKEKLKQFIEQANLTSSDLRVNIDDASLRIRRLDLPHMESNEVPEAIKWGLKNFVDGDIESYAFRYIMIDEKDLKLRNRVPLIVYAIRNQAVLDRVEYLKEIGLPEPKIVEPDAAALAMIFEFCKGKGRDTNAVLINLGYNLSHFLMMGKAGLLFVRPLSGVSDNLLVSQIARDLGLGPADAQEAKINYFNDPQSIADDIAPRLKNTIAHFYSNMAIEIQRSIDGYSLIFGRHNIEEVNLTGGGAAYSELAQYLEKNLALKVDLLNPFEKIDVSGVQGECVEKNREIFAIACGLAVD
ncbi:MAG: pilus assembly protein PilM [Pseudomonadota bacterium]